MLDQGNNETFYSGLRRPCNFSQALNEANVCACVECIVYLQFSKRSTIGVASAMASCEPKRTSVCSEDLRWRIVWQSEGLNRKCTKIASNLGVDTVTVSKTLSLFRCTGDVHKKTYYSEKAFRKLNISLEYMIIHIVLMHPGIYLHEVHVQKELHEETGAEVCLSTICRFLHRNSFTRQRLRIAASQRDDLLRAQFVSDVSLYKPEMLIFLDETGSDRRDCIRKYGLAYEESC